MQQKLIELLYLAVPDLNDKMNDLSSTCESIVYSINPKLVNNVIFKSFLFNDYFNYNV